MNLVDIANQRVQPLPAGIKEKDFVNAIIHVARFYQWLAHHTRPALTQSGRYITPLQGDPGFPDLTLARRRTLYIVEAKTEKGRLAPNQITWGDNLPLENGTYQVWRPRDWPRIIKLLSAP